MRAVIVDTNVLIDVWAGESPWTGWSAEALEREGESSLLVINPIIFAELALGSDSLDALEATLPARTYHRQALPWAAAFVAAHVHREYRRRGGEQGAVLPDFYIGAHALVDGMAVLTRDARRFRTYFPTLEVIAPDG